MVIEGNNTKARAQICPIEAGHYTRGVDEILGTEISLRIPALIGTMKVDPLVEMLKRLQVASIQIEKWVYVLTPVNELTRVKDRRLNPNPA